MRLTFFSLLHSHSVVMLYRTPPTQVNIEFPLIIKSIFQNTRLYKENSTMRVRTYELVGGSSLGQF